MNMNKEDSNLKNQLKIYKLNIKMLCKENKVSKVCYKWIKMKIINQNSIFRFKM